MQVIGILLLLTSLAEAKNYALQMGGNCESSYVRSGNENIFKNGMYLSRTFLEKNKWNVETLYDEKAEEFEKPAQASTKSAFLEKLDELIEKTSSGDGSDQVLIQMSSHGQKGGICISETEILNYDDPEFTKRLEILKSKSKLGFMTHACFSGSSIPALSKYGCAISSQSEAHVGWGAGKFEDLMEGMFFNQDQICKKGNCSLEDVYLSSLGNNPLNIPQISGFPEGERISKTYFDLFNTESALSSKESMRDFRRKAETDLSCVRNSFREKLLDLASGSEFEKLDQERLRIFFDHPPGISAESILQKRTRDQLSLRAEEIEFNRAVVELINFQKSYPEEPAIGLEGDFKRNYDQLSRVQEKMPPGIGLTLSSDGVSLHFENTLESERAAIHAQKLPELLKKSGIAITGDSDYLKKSAEYYPRWASLNANLNTARAKFKAKEESIQRIDKLEDPERAVESDIKAINYDLARRYLKSNRRSLPEADRDAREACRNFKLDSGR